MESKRKGRTADVRPRHPPYGIRDVRPAHPLAFHGRRRCWHSCGAHATAHHLIPFQMQRVLVCCLLLLPREEREVDGTLTPLVSSGVLYRVLDSDVRRYLRHLGRRSPTSDRLNGLDFEGDVQIGIPKMTLNSQSGK